MNRALSLYLDVVRFCAALLVLLHHAADPRLGTLLPHFLTSTGTDPVVVFFVLSGFVIAYTAETKDLSPGDYAVSRLSRLYSVVLPAIVLTLVLDKIGSQFNPVMYAERDYDASADFDHQAYGPPILTSLFLNEIWWLNVWPGTNAPFWSIGYEAPYYVLFGFLFYARDRIKLIGVIAACALIGPSVLLLAPVWFLGVATWHWYKRAQVKMPLGACLFVLSLVFYFAFVSSGARNYLNAQDPTRTLSDYVIGALFAASLIGFKGIAPFFESTLFLFSKSIRAAAGCTFSLYLYHYPLLLFFRAMAPGSDAVSRTDRSLLISSLVVVGPFVTSFLLSLVTEQKKDVVQGAIRGLLGAARA